MGANECGNRRLEAATISEILPLFGQGNLPFIREKSSKSQGILKTGVCGNHVTALKLFPVVCCCGWQGWKWIET